MKIGLIDVDSHNFPNLALMKISAYHKQRGDEVEWWNGLMHYDIVYMSKIFSYTPDIPWVISADRIVKGGTGYSLTEDLPYEIEHVYPDYDLYGLSFRNTAYGFLSRGCPRGCDFCIVSQKEGKKSVKHSDLAEWHHGQKHIELLDPNLLACTEWEGLLSQLENSGAWINFNQGLDVRMLTEEKAEAISRVKYKNIHFAWDRMRDEKKVKEGLLLFREKAVRKPNKVYATVYVLTNFDTCLEEDLERIYWLRDNGYAPYVMIFDKQHASKDVKRLARYVNNRPIFETIRSFEEYK